MTAHYSDNGKEVHSNLEKIRGYVGFCPQKDFFLMFNTVYENLSFFAEIKKIPAERIEEEIERVMTKLGLNTFRDMPAINLSGGFKRKLNVAIALLNDPKIILMDEPTSGNLYYKKAFEYFRDGSCIKKKLLDHNKGAKK